MSYTTAMNFIFNYPSNSDYETIDIFAMRYILIIVASNFI